MSTSEPWHRLRLISEPVVVTFDQPPLLEKKPHCPQSFTWRGVTYPIVEMLAEWYDYGRRGRMARNMAPEHLVTAIERGSWGVGRQYFRVRAEGGQVFEIYFDRAPKEAGHRKQDNI